MTPYLKTGIYFFSCLFFLSACNDQQSNSEPEKAKDTVVAVLPVEVKAEPVVLKDAVLNEKNLISNHRLTKSVMIDAGQYKLLSVKAIDSTAAESNFKYHIIDSLFSGAGHTILLIGREYDTENIVWIAAYDDQHKLIDRRQVYYDNAEGFLSIETTIKNNKLIIHTRNDFDETNNHGVDSFRLDNDFKFEKLK